VPTKRTVAGQPHRSPLDAVLILIVAATATFPAMTIKEVLSAACASLAPKGSPKYKPDKG
jgi:hypothetical protein